MTTDQQYFQRNEVSNSDLTSLKKYFMNADDIEILEDALRMGSLVDAMITEPEKCDHIKRQVNNIQFTVDEWSLAKRMFNAFRNNLSCQTLMKISTGQKVFHKKDLRIEHGELYFNMDARCKYDGWIQAAGYGWDVKTTTATTKQEFIEVCKFLDYDRARAFYMDTSGATKDMIIGISKKNMEVFQIPIDRNHSFYLEGKEKYQELSFKWVTMFGPIESIQFKNQVPFN